MTSEAKKDAKTVTIIVETQPHEWPKDKEISFEQVVNLAYDNAPPSGANWEFTVTYRRGNGNKPAGTLINGETVRVKEGMLFDVTATDRS